MTPIFEEMSSFIVIAEIIGVVTWALIKIGAAWLQNSKRHAGVLVRGSTPAREPEKRRRPYPKVLPKYRNPNDPFETWCGRGKQPRWVATQLALGRRLEEFRISPAATVAANYREHQVTALTSESPLELSGVG